MFWHSYECDDAECKRGPTGMILEIRTDWDKEPKGVRCPFCQRKPRYRGFWPATAAGFGGSSNADVSNDTVAEVLRTKKPEEVKEIVAKAKVIEGWMPHNNEAIWYVFVVGQPFGAVGHVARIANGSWICVVGSKTVASRKTRLDAQSVVEMHLQEQGYAVPSPAWLDAPSRHAAN
jgi:hypothetical protein